MKLLAAMVETLSVDFGDSLAGRKVSGVRVFEAGRNGCAGLSLIGREGRDWLQVTETRPLSAAEPAGGSRSEVFLYPPSRIVWVRTK